MPEKPSYEKLEEKVRELETALSVQKKAGNPRQESEVQFKAMIESTTDFVFFKDRNLRYSYVNPAMCSLFGRHFRELIGCTDDELFGGSSADHIRTVDARVLQGETVEEEDTKPVDGISRVFNVKKTPVLDEEKSRG